MLNDVVHKISDGLMGFGNSNGTGVHIKIGASAVQSLEPITITSSKKLDYIKNKLGLSPLTDAVMDSIENGASKIICIPVVPGRDGTVSVIEPSVTEESGSVSVTGKPNNAFEIVVVITGQGVLNTAAFKYSINGGYTYSEELTVPLGGTYELPDTGITLSFTVDGEKTFKVGDTYKWSTTAPQLTNENILNGIDRVKNVKAEAELVHVVGCSNADTWAAISTLQSTLQTQYHKPLMFVLEAFEPDTGESMADYVKRLVSARKQVKNFEIQVVPSRAMYIGMDGITRNVNLASVVCGMYGRTAVNQSIGQTATMAISEDKLLKLLPEGITDDVIDELDDNGYLTFRQYDGLEGYYVNNARTLGPEGTDYKYAEDARVVNKIIRETRKQALLQLQSDIDLENPTADLQAKVEFIKAPLDTMVNDKEISSAEVTLPDDAAESILKEEKLYLTVRYVQRGIIRSIEVDVGKSNPYAS